jgi:uncharacterized protein (DUF1786 family)
MSAVVTFRRRRERVSELKIKHTILNVIEDFLGSSLERFQDIVRPTIQMLLKLSQQRMDEESVFFQQHDANSLS